MQTCYKSISKISFWDVVLSDIEVNQPFYLCCHFHVHPTVLNRKCFIIHSAPISTNLLHTTATLIRAYCDPLPPLFIFIHHGGCSIELVRVHQKSLMILPLLRQLLLDRSTHSAVRIEVLANSTLLI